MVWLWAWDKGEAREGIEVIRGFLVGEGGELMEEEAEDQGRCFVLLWLNMLALLASQSYLEEIV